MRIIKTIRAFLLFIAGIAVVGHMVIPHDHHISGTGDSAVETCPGEEKTSHQIPLFPLHCHAFNDLAAEKFTPQIEKKENLPALPMLIWPKDELLPVLHIAHYCFIEYGESIPEIFHSEFSPNRAPPNMI